MTDRKTYQAWYDAWRRCYDPSRHNHESYKRRGIEMCAEWRADFTAFLLDMGEAPVGLTLERYDNDIGYNPDNCYWAESEDQYLNKGDYKNSTSGVKGVSFDRTHRKWCAHTKGGSGNKKRIYLGLDFFEAVCTRKSWENRNG